MTTPTPLPPGTAEPDDEALPPEFPETWERNWAVFCHLAGLSAMVLPGIGQIVGPLLLWLLRRHDSAYVDHHGREALNFQISTTLYSIVAAALTRVRIGFVLIAIVLVVWFVYMVIASVAASQGERYRYPLTLRLIA
jgi:uncharacterized Tic20 family protein